MKLSNSKFNALRKADHQQNLWRVCSYLDMVNYLKRFIPDFSTTTYALRKRVRQETRFEWSDQCEKFFPFLNSHLTDSAIHANFNQKKELTLFCDASSVGFSSILLHRDEHQKSNAMLNEMFVRDIKLFIWEKIKIYCDSKVLVNLLRWPIFKLTLHIEITILRLHFYNSEIEHVKSGNNIFDFISQLRNKQQTYQINKVIHQYVNFVTKAAFSMLLNKIHFWNLGLNKLIGRNY